MARFTYRTARELFESRRKGSYQMKIANNTYLIEGSVVDPHYAITLHGQRIIHIYPEGRYRYFTKGWMTVTTKARINEFGPVKVFQRAYEWFLSDGTPFHEGIEVFDWSFDRRVETELFDRFRSDPEGKCFVQVIEENPKDDSALLMFCDWLEERGRPEASILRRRVAERAKETQS